MASRGDPLLRRLTGVPPFAGGTTYETVRLTLETASAPLIHAQPCAWTVTWKPFALSACKKIPFSAMPPPRLWRMIWSDGASRNRLPRGPSRQRNAAPNWPGVIPRSHS